VKFDLKETPELLRIPAMVLSKIVSRVKSAGDICDGLEIYPDNLKQFRPLVQSENDAFLTFLRSHSSAEGVGIFLDWTILPRFSYGWLVGRFRMAGD
jgi:hypothetical protein